VNRRALIGTAAALVIAALVVVGVHEAGSVVRRPEGAAERFLTAASRRSAKDRAKADHFGPRDLARAFSGFRRAKTDDDYLTRIEVGRASGRHGTVRVPYRVRRNDASKSVVNGVLVVSEQPGARPRAWRVVGLEPCCQGVAPARHGSAPASVGNGVWLFGLALGVAFTIGSEVLLRALGARPRPRPAATQ